MLNTPAVKIGMVAVSRDCFPMSLSKSRSEAVAKCAKEKGLDLFIAHTIVENEKDAVTAIGELSAAGANALVVYLGNFGPETPETLLAQKFGGPVMFVAASEESKDILSSDRGDAYCGMLNASYNLALRKIKAYIPEYPVGTPDEVVDMIKEFVPVAKVQIGLKNLKIITFGPRPNDFLACNAPIKPLYDLGVEIMENSELDLYASFNAHKDDARIKDVMDDMAKELGKGNNHPGILEKLAQYELTLLDFLEANRGASKYVIFANKCWPAFQTQFGFVPCYVNSRLTSKGYCVSCETDVYGALTEFIITCATDMAPTLLDINNTVPKDLYEENKKAFGAYKLNDTFMGFHCGNTSACYLKNPAMKHQLIMKRSLEPDTEPDITRGTLEGQIAASEVTLFRLQSSAAGKLTSYIAQGEILDVDPCSFGGIAVFGIPEMGRFYRYVLVEKNYPHHAGVAFKHAGKTLFNVMKLIGIEDVAFNQPAGMLYENENPFK